MLARLEIDRAVAFSISMRAWQLAAGPVSLMLIAVFFSDHEQGFYYAFANLMAMQAFLELGLNVVVLNVTSGQWAHLKLNEEGRAVGDPAALARLGNFFRQLLKWYTTISLLFVVGVGAAGYFFLQMRPDPSTDWYAPWWALTLFTAGRTWTWPLVSVLEGCNRVTAVNRYRLAGAVLANLAVWTVMLCGGGLWAAAASAAVHVAVELHLALVKFRPLFTSLLAVPRTPKLQWKLDVWPLQWRQAIIVSFQYFELSLLTLVIFAYHGDVLAGQTGMTWTLATTLHAAALAWVQTRAPKFGALVAQENFKELDRLYRRVTTLAVAAALAGLVAIGCLVAGLDKFNIELRHHRLADRVLPLSTVLVFLAVMTLKVPPYCMAFYIRAHRREPLLPISVASSIASGLLVWLGGWHYGPLGAGLGLLASTMLINVPGHYYIWRKFKAEHRVESK